MKKFSVLLASLLLVVGMAVGASAAPIATGTLLTIDAGVQPGGGGTAVTSGSYFGMDAYGTGPIPTALTPGTDNGIIVGVQQTEAFPVPTPAGGPTSSGKVTNTWFFFGNNGINSIGDASLNSFDDSGTATIGSWDVVWNDVSVPMGGGILDAFTVVGNSYTLDYRQTVPAGVPGWSGVPYNLHLEGNIVPVPEPASMLLIGSGLAGIFGIRRKMKK